MSGISAATAPAEGPAVAASQPGSDPAAVAVESAPGLTETAVVGEEVGRAGARVPDAAPGAALVVAAETAEVATMRAAPEAVEVVGRWWASAMKPSSARRGPSTRQPGGGRRDRG